MNKLILNFKTKLLGLLTILLLSFVTPTVTAATFTVDTSTAPLTGLWWNQNESGWGISLTQQGPIVFVAWYTYDQSGNPKWYVMSSCTLSGNACTGSIYAVTGGTAPALPWNGSSRIVGTVGTGTFTFTDNNTGTFNYSINGISGQKVVTRQMFASGAVAPATNYSGLWWNANESGWGVALTQQYGVIFATLYVYDANGNPVWYVASNCAVVSSGCTGDLYQVNGGSAPTTTWAGENRLVTKVGTISLAFTSGSNGTMNYSVNGANVSKAITVQQFYTAPVVSPYAGGWSGSYSGNDQGTCSMTISNSGSMSGSCHGNQAGTFAITGTVDAQGNLTFYLGSGSNISTTFTGKFATTTRVNGTWANPSVGYSGTWFMNHN
ncbi:hypothetical protein BH11PSE11_BH11PSE11_38780 [soil metagenome]